MNKEKAKEAVEKVQKAFQSTAQLPSNPGLEESVNKLHSLRDPRDLQQDELPFPKTVQELRAFIRSVVNESIGQQLATTNIQAVVDAGDTRVIEEVTTFLRNIYADPSPVKP